MDLHSIPGELWDGGAVSPRVKWRIAQITARRWDRWYPLWWTDEKLHAELLALMTPSYRRIWSELLRQRRGL